jgi:hypothetical protein
VVVVVGAAQKALPPSSERELVFGREGILLGGWGQAWSCRSPDGGVMLAVVDTELLKGTYKLLKLEGRLSHQRAVVKGESL